MLSKDREAVLSDIICAYLLVKQCLESGLKDLDPTLTPSSLAGRDFSNKGVGMVVE